MGSSQYAPWIGLGVLGVAATLQLVLVFFAVRPRVTGRGPEAIQRWAGVHIPVAFAIPMAWLTGAMSVLAAAGRVSRPDADSLLGPMPALWLPVGGAAALATCIACAALAVPRRPGPAPAAASAPPQAAPLARRGVFAWFVASLVALLLAFLGRGSLIDGQLFMLASVTLIWWALPPRAVRDTTAPGSLVVLSALYTASLAAGYGAAATWHSPMTLATACIVVFASAAGASILMATAAHPAERSPAALLGASMSAVFWTVIGLAAGILAGVLAPPIAYAGWYGVAPGDWRTVATRTPGPSRSPRH